MNETLFDQKPTEVVMSTDLVERDHELQQVPLSPATILQRMVESGQDPRPMMDIFREWEDRIAAEAFGDALAAFQAKCPRITKNRQIDLGGGKGPLYASLDDIDLVVRPILAQCGLSVRYSAAMTDAGQVHATCFVRHGRHEESSEVTLPVPSQMRVNDTQKMGAALSYAKRYALCDALNIIVTDQDTDGEGLVETLNQEQIATLDEWLSQLPAPDTRKFMEYIGAKSLAEIRVGDFDKALAALRKKVGAKR
jgi:hypothetical protein